jgi:general secretion pathway protein K
MKRRDAGYAMIAAVAAIAAFSAVSFEVMATSRGEIADVSAEVERARLEAAADSAVALAIEGLGVVDETQRWPIDGRPRRLIVNGLPVVVTVEDERGKVPINELDEIQTRALFAAAGVDGMRLDALTDAFEDWQDDDDVARPHGAETPAYAAQGIAPRDGGFRTVDELAELKGMDGALFARLKPALTVNFGNSGGFSAETANPLAIGVMTGAGADSPEALDREKELQGERPALEIESGQDLTGRALTIHAVVRDGGDGNFTRSVIAELTGNKAHPYWIRSAE